MFIPWWQAVLQVPALSLGSLKITMKAKVLDGLGRQGRFSRIGGLGGPTGTSDQRE